jgi:hypothetical protein
MFEQMFNHISDDRCTSSRWKAVVMKPGRRFGWHLVLYIIRSCHTSGYTIRGAIELFLESSLDFRTFAYALASHAVHDQSSESRSFFH